MEVLVIIVIAIDNTGCQTRMLKSVMSGKDYDLNVDKLQMILTSMYLFLISQWREVYSTQKKTSLSHLWADIL